jgi:pilus assembly protein CpaE
VGELLACAPDRTTSPVRVLVVDDSEPVRATIRQMVDVCGDGAIEVVGEAADGPGAVRLAREIRPDAVLMDINLPGCDGITAAARIRQEVPARIVMISVENGREYFRRAMQVGAVDYLVKPFTPEGLVEALRGGDSSGGSAAGAAARLAPVIAVCGAKGGVGASTVALNLALAMGRHLPAPGAALRDLDPEGGLLPVLAGLDRASCQSGEPLPLGGGAATLVPDAASVDARRRFGVVVCDVGRGAGLAGEVAEACGLGGAGDAGRPAEGRPEAPDLWLLLVTTGEVAALHAAMRLLGGPAASLPRERVHLAVNRIGRPGSVRPDEVARTLGLPAWTALPEEAAALEAANLGRPLLHHRSRGAFASSIEQLAGRLAAAALGGPPA